MKKEIIDKEAVRKIVNQLFGKMPVFVRFYNKEFPVKIIGMKPQGLIVKLPVKMDKGPRILSVTHNDHKFLGEFTFLGGDETGNEILSAVKFSVEEAKREVARVVIPENTENRKLKIINIINQIDVTKAIGFTEKKIENLIQAVDAKLKEDYPESSVYFSARMDNRLRMMYNYDKPIYIVSKFESHTVPAECLPYDEYIKIIRLNKIGDQFMSEISVMVRYKGYIPFGYIQVLSETKLTPDDFNKINLLASTFSKGTIKAGIFHESKELCSVNDISLQGLNFMHPQSRFFSKSFGVGETIYFDLMLADVTKGTYRAIIRNIQNTEKDFRVGCQFFNLPKRETDILNEIVAKSTE